MEIRPLFCCGGDFIFSLILLVKVLLVKFCACLCGINVSWRIPDTQFWRVRLCIRGLLPKGGSEGPCLGEVPCHKKRKNVSEKKKHLIK